MLWQESELIWQRGNICKDRETWEESEKGGVDYGDEEQLREEIQKVSELGWLEG